MRFSCLLMFVYCSFCMCAQAQDELKQRAGDIPKDVVRVDAGTHILLSMVNSVSTKQAAPGDRVYLQTAFPVLVEGHVVIPPGSWVTGTVTDVKRPGRVKGKGMLQVRFDSLTLPNGVTKSFRSDLGAIDGRSNETLDRENSKVKSAGNKKSDTVTIASTGAAGAAIGAMSRGGASGTLIGAGAGAAAGLIGVLATRGPDAVLTKGSTVEMVLDRPLTFQKSELGSHGGAPRANDNGAEATPPAAPRSFGPHVPF